VRLLQSIDSSHELHYPISPCLLHHSNIAPEFQRVTALPTYRNGPLRIPANSGLAHIIKITQRSLTSHLSPLHNKHSKP